MTKDEFERMAKEIQKGNNKALAPLQDYQIRCVKMLSIKSGNKCSTDDAYDIFIDAIMDFRSNILKGKIYHQNIGAYLKSVCWNKWLALTRKRQRQQSKIQSAAQDLYGDNTDPDEIAETENRQQQQLSTIKTAMQQLTEKCRTILTLAIVEELSMAEIAMLLKLSNANVAKTTKSRCYKNLMQIINQSVD